MAASKMSLLKGATAMLGVFALPALARAPYSDDQSIETVGPQEIGTTTVDGFLVYSMNFCTITHHTECQISLSTGGAAPVPETTSVDAAEPTTDAGESGDVGEPFTPTASPSEDYGAPSSGATQPGETGGSDAPGETGPSGEPSAPVATSTDTAGEPTAETSDGAYPTGDASASDSDEPTGDATATDGQEGTPTGTPSSTPTVDAASNLSPGAFLGAAVVAALLL